MALHLSPNQLITWVHRLTHFVAWLTVAIVTLTVVVIAVTALYFAGVSGSDIYRWASALSDNLGFAAAGSVLSFFGVSAFGLLSFCAILLKRLVLDLSLRYILKGVNRAPSARVELG